MRFNPKARLDNRRVRDVGGSGGPRGSGSRIPGGMGSIPIPTGKMGLGVVVIVVLAIFVLPRLGIDMGSITGGAGLDPSRVTSETNTGRYDNCTSGADANGTDAEAIDCQLVAVENSLNDYWSQQPQTQSAYQPEDAIITFSGEVSTGGCGNAGSGVGPFYCPVDQTIYLDTQFYADVLEDQLGGTDAPFVRAYVIGHEFGHHLQNLLGYLGQVKTQQGPMSDAVRLELQADCLAGMWARHATTTEDEDGNVLLLELTQADIADGIQAAKTVGDDYIQQQSGARVDSDGWTHGSSQQRIAWFNTGFGGTADDIDVCNTFAASTL
ncbi:MAG: KPN_02809 family neutral zinc metallopeptidase [Nocardioides sp.]